MSLLDDKEKKLHALLKGYGCVAVGFSGGVDSTLLLRVAVDVLGSGNVLALIADTPSLPRKEFAEALRLAEPMGAECAVIDPDELSDPAYAANPADRCYFCKKCLFSMIARVAAEKGFATVLDGNNADDAGDYRPGRRAAVELGVKSPLMEAGLTKAEIRALSARAGLPTADKPAMACLASRIPYGTRVTAEVLGQVERAEDALRAAGFAQCRVRHHGDIARIEVAVAELPRLLAEGLREEVVRAVRAAGYRYVTLDLQGYRMGSMNEKLADQK
ncbi:MAG TPA: ATP-dependent sacrificial sulfur transferase LarE [Kiritimatiellia bacterium]|nr:ATP-dependent sacrificial sulfur transferase LarE [Kiritimatiellia bacterium]HPS08679.1 ATP-dependent sacrificial sulfur transferase LarE [Kiritimatiellia bacterium]